jgi:hypothetical protein
MTRAAKAHPNQLPFSALSLRTPPSAAGSDTSLAAARSMRRPSQRYRELVLGYIEARGERGATADEVQAALRLSHQNGSARVSELAKHGFIVDSGMRRVTRSGRRAAVYVVPARRELPPPDAMHGAGDGFGGSDFP